jgi:hypothetical protein
MALIDSLLCRFIQEKVTFKKNCLPIVGKERKAIFAKLFEKQVSKGKDVIIFIVNMYFGAVVQLVRISACHAEGRGFESRPHRKI